MLSVAVLFLPVDLRADPDDSGYRRPGEEGFCIQIHDGGMV